MIPKKPSPAFSPSVRGETVGIITLGCARNTVDSEKILWDAKRRGARISRIEDASVVFVNTCAFTKEAKEESIETILDLIDRKKQGRIKRIIVYGCLSERYDKELKKAFGEVDAFAGIADFKAPETRGVRITPRHYAYLKIAEGCANSCTFCAIPSIKGPLRSRALHAVVEEARQLEEEGVRELVVVGQDITLYGQEGEGNPRGCGPLVGLLEKILSATSIPWVRLLYLSPWRVSECLLDLVASEKRVCPYIDVPLQHANDRILKLMGRQTSRHEVVGLIGKIRRRLPQASVRTSMIVGFPSETEKEFLELCDFVKQTRFDKLGVFKYSREEGTAACAFRGQKHEATKQARFDRLMSLQRGISAQLLRRRVGETVEVLVDEAPAGGELSVGRSRHEAPEVDGIIHLKSRSRLKPGSLVSCRLTDSFEYDLVGEVVS